MNGGILLTLLSDWQKKESWKNQFIMCPFYKSKKAGIDINLAAMLKKQSNPILDIESGIGFERIDYIYNPPQNFEFGQKIYDLSTVNKITKKLLKTLREYLELVWDPKIFHLIFCSGGTDSRILSSVLMEMRNDGFDLGELLFLCHNQEIKFFKPAMKALKWDEYEYQAYKEKDMFEVDYYDWGNFSFNMNGFMSPRLDFFTGILKQLNLTTKDVCLATGVIHDVLWMYPSTAGKSKDHRGYKELDLQIFKNWTSHFKPYYLPNYANYADVLYPFINYKYLDIAFQVPNKFFVREPGLNDKTHWTLDVIRAGMLKELENKKPVSNMPATYNLKFSKHRRYMINNNWKRSALYKDFPEVQHMYNPGKEMPNQNAIDCRLYGLATCYEAAKN